MPLFAPTFIHPGYPAGKYVSLWPGISATASVIPAIDIIYFHPCWVLCPITFASFAMRVVTLGAGSSIKVGLWANNPTNNHPVGTALFKDDTGVTTQASATTVVPVSAGSIAPGLYWFGTKCTGTPPALVSVNSGNTLFPFLVGTDSAVMGQLFGLSLADTYSNAMPTISAGQAFTSVAVAGIPVGGFLTA